MVLWTYGIREASKPSSKPSIRQSLKGLLNPNIIAFALGFAVIVIGIRIPPFLEVTLVSLSAVASPLCMVCIGCLYFYSQMVKVLMQPEIYVGIALKMSILPLVCMPLLSMLSLGDDIVPSLLLMMAMLATT